MFHCHWCTVYVFVGHVVGLFHCHWCTVYVFVGHVVGLFHCLCNPWRSNRKWPSKQCICHVHQCWPYHCPVYLPLDPHTRSFFCHTTLLTLSSISSTHYIRCLSPGICPVALLCIFRNFDGVANLCVVFVSLFQGGLSPPACQPLPDNTYKFVYSCSMPMEAAILGLVSLVLTLINIICIFLMGIFILKVCLRNCVMWFRNNRRSFVDWHHVAYHMITLWKVTWSRLLLYQM